MKGKVSDEGDRRARAAGAQLRDRLLAQERWLTSEEIPSLAGVDRETYASDLPSRRQLISVRHEGRYLYPAVQFDSRGVPFPRLPELLNFFPKQGWSGIFWLFQPTTRLNGERPADVLATDMEAVIAAARTDFLGDPDGW